MRKHVKIIISLSLILMISLLLPVAHNSAAAVSASGTWDNLSWFLDSSGLLTISGSGAMKNFYTTGDDAWRAYENNITRVEIQPGVTSIGECAFKDCVEISSVEIPNTVSSIGGYAFRCCSKLTEVMIPSSVNEIGPSAFSECSRLTSVVIPDGVPRIGEYLFMGCSKLESITIPGSVTWIGTDAFNSCESLTSVTLSEGLTGIGTRAFSRCSSLTSITIPTGVTSIGSSAFSDCSSLTNVAIPGSVTYISSDAFFSCTGLTTLTVSYGVTSIGRQAFRDCENLVSVSLPDSLKSIDYSAFAYCSSLKSITIPDSVTTIGSSEFAGCKGLVSVSLPNSLKSIGTSAFADCSSLKDITISGEITSIEEYMFSNCVSLAHVSIPVTVTSIGTRAFSNCNNLTDIYYGGSQEQWNAIEIESTNTPLFIAVIHYSEEPEGTYYYVAYEPNGGSGAPSRQTKSEGETLVLSSTEPTRSSYSAGIYIVRLDANGGSVSTSSLNATKTTHYTFKNWNTAANGSGTSYTPGANYTANENMTLYAQWNSSVTAATVNLPTPTRNGYYFKGWATSASATSGAIGSYTPSGSVTLYAIWEEIPVYTVAYHANGGTGAPSSQTKEENAVLTLSDTVPTKKYVVQYNAGGGSVSPSSKSITCSFKNWNTSRTGGGTSYAPGGIYTANENVTLYAQWTEPSAGTLATPTRNGYAFTGWFTSSTGGVQITDSSTITENITVYAHWMALNTDPYNMGDETYSFENYGDSDSFGGHCFGMSITSAGYHNGLLDISRIGGNSSTSLYSFGFSQTVKEPICYYQGIQGSYSRRATVAGGSYYLNGYNDTASDWQEVVNYVRNHEYDNTGLLQIGFRKNNEGGHAINFLRYENVNGQDRIYAYDNNFPNQETYFYYSGKIWQAPVQTFGGPIDCIALRDCRVFFSIVGDFDSTRALYMPKEAATVPGYAYTFMDGGFSDQEYVMYEIPKDQDSVIIVPNRDNAEFIYMDTAYSFGAVSDETRGEFTFASSFDPLNESARSHEASFRIFETESGFSEPDYILPSALTQIGESAFEGVSARIIYVPDGCTSIEAYAFRNSGVTQIRIPANCSIATSAFDGCSRVEIYGTPGSQAETYCNSHDNCRFFDETR